MKDSRFHIYIKILLNFMIAVFWALVILFLIPKLLRFFMPFVIGWIVSMIANPLVRFLEKKVKLLRKHSSAIIIVAVVAAIVGVFYLLIYLLVNEIIDLIDHLPELVEGVQIQLQEVSNRLSIISKSLPFNIQSTIDNLVVKMDDYISNFVKNMEPPTFSTASNFAKNIAEGFLMVIITILSAYFFIAGREEMIVKVNKYIPKMAKKSYYMIVQNFKTAFGGYFKAQFKIMILIIAIMFIGFEILRIDYSFLLASGIAFLDFLPFFGTGAVLWPWALFDMIAGNYMRAIGLVVIYLICQILKQLLQPKMVGDSIGISPFTTLIFMFIGYRFYGVLGMIFGIPVGMVLVNLYLIGMFDRILKGFQIIIHDINEFRKY
ncbi:MAG: hypothetical protein K0S47_2468 [Herbinix sp.]|nr:hypothetical protein [Herbinix sp.]